MTSKEIVYVLQHVCLQGDGEPKFLGVYASRESAEAAVSRFAQKQGFEKHPDGFSIDKYELDKDYWESGFISD